MLALPDAFRVLVLLVEEKGLGLAVLPGLFLAPPAVGVGDLVKGGGWGGRGGEVVVVFRPGGGEEVGDELAGRVDFHSIFLF